MLQLDVSELVDRASLSQDASPVGIVEEGHELPGQPTSQRTCVAALVGRRTAKPRLPLGHADKQAHAPLRPTIGPTLSVPFPR